jgi:hypothetical protein
MNSKKRKASDAANDESRYRDAEEQFFETVPEEVIDVSTLPDAPIASSFERSFVVERQRGDDAPVVRSMI